jgi:restriction system protein
METLGILTIIVLLVGFSLVAIDEWRARRRMIQKIEIIVSEHEKALVRKRFQTLRRDDYGNLVADQWIKEINYFIINVLRSRLSRRQWRSAESGWQRIVNKIATQVSIASASYEGVSDSVASPIEYEQFCASKLREAGWDARVTKASGDQGVDIVAEKNGIRLVLQCKWYSQPVGNKAVQEVVAARAYEMAQVAAVVTNSRYTPAAQRLAAVNGVLLLHHTDLGHVDTLLTKKANSTINVAPP